MTEPTDETLRQWLLGRLPARDAEALEERLLTDEEFGVRLRAAEDDLLDDFVRERLHDGERARAAAYFAATPADRARLRIARALASVAGVDRSHHPRRSGAITQTHESHVRQHSRRRLAALASVCAILIAVVGVRFWFVAQTPALTITLSGDQQRGAEALPIAIPRANQRVRIQAEVDGASSPAERYSLRIDAAGAVVFAADDLVAENAGAYRFVEVTLPARALAPGEHRVHVVARSAPNAESSWLLSIRDE
ncbi:MAG TPA: hypothetical protein VH375_08655 [Rhodanobacteraceae bacterium]